MTYLMLFSFTQQGLKNIKESPARIEAAKETIRRLGGDVQAFYAILGSDYDTVFILTAPNDEKVAEMALAVSMTGNVRSQTHRLFSEDEFRTVVSSLR